jgi:hypothetical protein
MDLAEKQSNKSLYGFHRQDMGDQYGIYHDEDEPMSVEERSLVRKIDFFIMPIICIIDFLQVKTRIHSISRIPFYNVYLIVFG